MFPQKLPATCDCKSCFTSLISDNSFSTLGELSDVVAAVVEAGGAGGDADIDDVGFIKLLGAKLRWA